MHRHPPQDAGGAVKSQETSTLPSRRQLREAGQLSSSRKPVGPTSTRTDAHVFSRRHRWVPRVAVLGTLAVATIAMPMSANAEDTMDGASPFEPEDANRIGTLDVIADAGDVAPIAQTVAAPIDRSARVTASSRSADRDPLPECDPTVRPKGTNGNLSAHELCPLWQAGESLRPDAAVSLAGLNDAFHAQFGRNICLVSSYRTLSSQRGVAASKGRLAATPGKSMHGWGLAIDLCSSETGNRTVYSWIMANIGTYGWELPEWARPGGAKPEAWHLEYRRGVEEVTTPAER